LTVAPAARQPASPEEGTILWTQARGGNAVSFVTRGGTHRYAGLPDQLLASCVGLPDAPGKPLYLTVVPDALEATVEARLYELCDTTLPVDPRSAFDLCAADGSLVTSATLIVRRSTAMPQATIGAEGGVDAGLPDAGAEAGDG
jgi:hypothetical protein